MSTMIDRAARIAAPASLPTRTVSMNTAAAQGEVALWRAVIDQAITDATLGLLKGEPGRKKQARPSVERMIHRDQARTWLLGMGKDFREVCSMALLEPDAVRAAARRQIAQADAMPIILPAPKPHPIEHKRKKCSNKKAEEIAEHGEQILTKSAA
jgi:hypothetical protein